MLPPRENAAAKAEGSDGQREYWLARAALLATAVTLISLAAFSSSHWGSSGRQAWQHVNVRGGSSGTAGTGGVAGAQAAAVDNVPVVCEEGFRATVGCDPFGKREPSDDKDCNGTVASMVAGFCHCSQGLTAQRWGCERRADFTCRDACDALNRLAVRQQRAELEASPLVQRWRQRQPPGFREADLQAMSNTAACQLSRSLRGRTGLADEQPPMSVAAAVEADFYPWRRGFTRDDVWRMAEYFPPNNVQMIWEVKNGSFAWMDRARHANCDAPASEHPGEACMILDKEGQPTGTLHGTDGQFFSLLNELRAGVAEGKLQPPDCLFFLSVNDDSYLCPGPPDGEPACAAPMLTFIRHTGHQEVPVPLMWGINHTTYDWSWDQKQEIAFWRGTAFCGDHPIDSFPPALCSRTALDETTKLHPGLLNITVKTAEGGTVPEADFTKWKYLAHLDGYSASSRLSKLMHSNSVVLKQESAWQEWYYRWLRPCVHYIPFWTRSPDDIIDEVLALRQADDYAKELAASSQALALKYTGRNARLKYWQAVLENYASLQRD